MAARRYAEGTTVPTEKSRAEIETLVIRYGADAFGYMMIDGHAEIQFRFRGMQIRFNLKLPIKGSKEFQYTPAKHIHRSIEQQHLAWDMACRQKWRAMALAVKAKLASVDSGIATFEEEFFAYVVDPVTNRTAYEIVYPQLKASYESDEPIPLRLSGPN
jgi:hypothetical protein